MTRTSHSHPVSVAWLPLVAPLPGKAGLTFASGKWQPNAASGFWDRDLALDLARLKDDFDAAHLVCLLEDHELRELRIERLPDVTAELGIALSRLPIADGTVSQDAAAVASLVSDIVSWAQSGENVVVHCKGGLGRAGTIGGCVLRSSGMDAQATLAALVEARGPNCPKRPPSASTSRSSAAKPRPASTRNNKEAAPGLSRGRFS